MQEHPHRDRWVGPRRQGRRARRPFRQGDRRRNYRSYDYRAIQCALVSSERLGYTPIEYKKHAEVYAEKVLDTVAAAAKSTGIDCETLHIEHEHVYQAIIDAAAARKCDLIIMASHGRRGASAIVLGSETVKVLTHSKIPVLVYR